MALYRIFNKSYLCVLIILLTLASNYSQQRERPNLIFNSSISFEINFLPNDSSISCFLSYKIPLSDLVFIKKNSEFTAGLTLNFDIKENGKIVDRKVNSKVVLVDSYERTKSTAEFVEGLVKLHQIKNEVTIQPFLSIANGSQGIQIDSLNIKPALPIEKFGKPIVLLKQIKSCSSKNEFSLVNNKYSIPFSTENYSMIIPVYDQTIKVIDVRIIQDGKNVFTKKISNCISKNYEFTECDNSIVLSEIEGAKNHNYFLISDFSKILDEGKAQFVITYNDGGKYEFALPVVWQNKPRSLISPESAIQLLTIIDNEDKINSLLNADKEEYSKVLNNYWNDKKSNGYIAFNDLKSEFYKRADYAQDNFSTIENQRGAFSDRGKTYIKFGKPDDTIRQYNTSNIVKEIWIYKKLKREFSFIDKSGLCNYTFE